jgi:hypothetical protein
MTLYLGIRKGGNFEKKRTRFKLITPIFSVSKKCMLEQKGKRKTYFSSFFFFFTFGFPSSKRRAFKFKLCYPLPCFIVSPSKVQGKRRWAHTQGCMAVAWLFS